AERENLREESLRSAAQISKSLLDGMVRKKWIAREDVSAARDAARTVKIAVLVAAEASPPQDGSETRPHTGPGKLNANQQSLISALKAAGGPASVETLQALDVPRTTLSTLVKRGLIEIVEEPQGFTVSKIKARRSPFEFNFSAQQKK